MSLEEETGMKGARLTPGQRIIQQIKKEKEDKELTYMSSPNTLYIHLRSLFFCPPLNFLGIYSLSTQSLETSNVNNMFFLFIASIHTRLYIPKKFNGGKKTMNLNGCIVYLHGADGRHTHIHTYNLNVMLRLILPTFALHGAA